VDAGHPAIFAFERELGAERLLVIVNLSGTECTLEFAPDLIARWCDASLLFTNASTDTAPEPSGVQLTPWEAVVYAGRRMPA